MRSILLSTVLSAVALINAYPTKQVGKFTVTDLTVHKAFSIQAAEDTCPTGDQASAKFDFVSKGSPSTHEYFEDALEGLQIFYEDTANCMADMVMITAGNLSIAMVIGTGFARSSITPVFNEVKSVSGHFGEVDGFSLQLCGSNRTREHTFGVAVAIGDSTTISAYQEAWGSGQCADLKGSVSTSLDISIEEAAVNSTTGAKVE